MVLRNYVLLCLLASFVPEIAEADAPLVPPTFAYETPAEKEYLRALLEVSTVLSVGLVWYITTSGLADDYDLNYSWPVFRRKLTGQALGLDHNHFNTNFVGHPIGGSAYYLAARGNRLDIAESAAFTLGGSLIWEYFGEVSEQVSLNDAIVTPLAGIAIGEAFTQLGAFFDRSRPNLPNRALGAIFGPFKRLSDLLDGATVARAEHTDPRGFPRNEGHRFDLRSGGALTWRAPTAAHTAAGEWRFSLASELARLPGYDGEGRHSLVFSDANVSNIALAGAEGGDGLVELEFETSVVMVGRYVREAARDRLARLWGHRLSLGWSLGFHYGIHDYARDDETPIDKLAGVSPLGVLFDFESVSGAVLVRLRVEGSGDFAGVTPIALGAYRQGLPEGELPELVRDRGYYFAIGARFAASLIATVGPFEAEANVRFDAYEDVRTAGQLADQRSLLRARLGSALPGTVARLSAVVERRTRTGSIDGADDEQRELGFGLELGARL